MRSLFYPYPLTGPRQLPERYAGALCQHKVWRLERADRVPSTVVGCTHLTRHVELTITFDDLCNHGERETQPAQMDTRIRWRLENERKGSDLWLHCGL
ncbi:hypothetical protein D3C87_1895370 [compost metagenome]